MAGPQGPNIRQRLDTIIATMNNMESRLNEGSCSLIGPQPDPPVEVGKSPSTVEDMLQYLEIGSDRVFRKVSDLVDRI